MRRIIETLLGEGIDESMIHRVLDLIEEEYEVIDEGRLYDEKTGEFTQAAADLAQKYIPMQRAIRKRAEKQVKPLGKKTEEAKAAVKTADQNIEDARKKFHKTNQAFTDASDDWNEAFDNLGSNSSVTKRLDTEVDKLYTKVKKADANLQKAYNTADQAEETKNQAKQTEQVNAEKGTEASNKAHTLGNIVSKFYKGGRNWRAPREVNTAANQKQYKKFIRRFNKRK